MLVDIGTYYNTNQLNYMNKLYTEQVRQLYFVAPIGLIANLINPLLVTYILWDIISHVHLSIWLFSLMSLTLLRYILIYKFKHTSVLGEKLHRWGRWFVGYTTLSGIIWGSVIFFAFPENSLHYQAFLTFVLGGMVAGAAVTYAALKEAFLTYAIPVLIPLMGHFFFSDNDTHFAMAVMIFIYTVLIFLIFFRIHKTTLSTLKLSFENNDLILNLKNAKKVTDNFNEKLQLELVKRKKMETELKNYHNHLEDIVKERTLELSLINDQLKHEIEERKTAQERQHLSEIVFKNTSEGVIITDSDKNIIAVNPAFTHITGYLSDDVIGKTPQLLNSGRHSKNFYSNLWSSLNDKGQWQGEILNRRKNGETYPEWLNISVVKNHQGAITNYVAVFSDITALKQSEERMEYLATHDPLTNLPNRLLLNDRLEHALEHAKRHNTKLWIFYLDLDNFKNINDTFGHTLGDQLLITVANRLKMSIRKEDTIARLGGDEFVIITESITDLNNAEIVASRILDTLSHPIYIEDNKIFITTSIGISFYPDHGYETNILIKNADIAMYHAKKQGRNNYQFYSLEAPAFT